MNMRFQDRATIITGAASGMGLVASQEMDKEGAAVYRVDINAERLNEDAQEICTAGGKAVVARCSTTPDRYINRKKKRAKPRKRRIRSYRYAAFYFLNE